MGIFEWLKLPSDCFLCGCEVNSLRHSSNNRLNSPIICLDCHSRLPRPKNTCSTCGLPLYPSSDLLHQNKPNYLSCGECLKSSPVYNRTISGFHYRDPINQLIARVKFSADFKLLPLLCEYLLDEIHHGYKEASLPNAIIAIPLHKSKYLQRGFNQSDLIAKKVAGKLSIPVLQKGITRTRATKAQLGLSANERKKNVKGAFNIDIKLPKHIAIVDDVVTTGTTVSELAKQARQQGALKIDIWCLARAYEI